MSESWDTTEAMNRLFAFMKPPSTGDPGIPAHLDEPLATIIATVKGLDATVVDAVHANQDPEELRLFLDRRGKEIAAELMKDERNHTASIEFLHQRGDREARTEWDDIRRKETLAVTEELTQAKTALEALHEQARRIPPIDPSLTKEEAKTLLLTDAEKLLLVEQRQTRQVLMQMLLRAEAAGLSIDEKLARLERAEAAGELPTAAFWEADVDRILAGATAPSLPAEAGATAEAFKDALAARQEAIDALAAQRARLAVIRDNRMTAATTKALAALRDTVSRLEAQLAQQVAAQHLTAGGRPSDEAITEYMNATRELNRRRRAVGGA